MSPLAESLLREDFSQNQFLRSAGEFGVNDKHEY